MRNLRSAVIGIVGSLLLMPTAASAFDGKREGFVLGGGIGGGGVTFEELVYFRNHQVNPKHVHTEPVIATYLSIGWGINEKFVLIFSNHTVWFEKDIGHYKKEEEHYSTGVTGAGFTYYLDAEARSLFVTGALGLSHWENHSISIDTATGFGVFGGVGCEFARHWAFELSVMWGKPCSSHGWELCYDPLSVTAAITGLAY